jgi:hypothetical protein
LLIPEMDSWLIYLPILMASFLWQIALILQRFLELSFNSTYMLVAIGVCVFMNIVLNLIFVPKYGIIASSLILFVTAVFYSGFMVILSLILSKRLQAE